MAGGECELVVGLCFFFFFEFFQLVAEPKHMSYRHLHDPQQGVRYAKLFILFGFLGLEFGTSYSLV